MRAGAVVLTLLLALLSFEASGWGAVPVRDAHGEIAVSVSSHTPVCPDDDVALPHQCCPAICGSLMPAPVNTLDLRFLLLGKLTIVSDLSSAATAAERLYRPPKVQRST